MHGNGLAELVSGGRVRCRELVFLDPEVIGWVRWCGVVFTPEHISRAGEIPAVVIKPSPDDLGLVPIPRPESSVGPVAVLATMDEDGPVVGPLNAVDERIDGLAILRRSLEGVLNKISLSCRIHQLEYRR